LAEGLKDNKGITSLILCIFHSINIACNNAEAEGAKHISEALKINKTLSKLDLSKDI